MRASRAMEVPLSAREWRPAGGPMLLSLLVIGMLGTTAFLGLFVARGGEQGYLVLAAMLGLAWAAWALPHPDRILKTMFLLTPVLNPGLPWSPFNLYLSSVLILIAGLSTLASALTPGSRHDRMRDVFRNGLAAPLFLFVAVNALSMAINGGATLNEGIRVVLLVLQVYVVAFVVCYVAIDKERVSGFLPWLLAGGTLGMAAALVSAVDPGFDPWATFSRIEGADAPIRSLSRIQGAFLHPNNLGIFGAYLIVCLVGLSGHFRRWAPLLWVCGAVAVVALLLTLSRGAWLGAVAGLGTLFFLQRRSRTSGIVVVSLGLLALWLLFSQGGDVIGILSERIGDSTPRSLAERRGVWESNIQLLTDRPILGAGPGTGRAMVDDAHNSYLQVLAETGVVGAMVYGALLLAVGRELLQAIRRSRGTRMYHIAVAAAGVWAAFLTIGLLHTSSAQVFSNWFPGLMLGLSMAINRLPIEDGVVEAAVTSPRAAGLPNPRATAVSSES